MDQYQKGPIIGEGTYGTVLCATHKATGKSVALKKVKMRTNKEGINMSVLRELKALRALKSPYVVDLLDVFTTKSSLVLVFEYMDWSLEDVVKDKGCPLTTADIKAYMQMLLQALAHVHSHQVAHRDVKPDNMLIGSNGIMKLADFGLARSLSSSPESSNSKLTPQVFGRWYRPPELLMGCSTYGCAVDMWAVGCVLAELLLRRPWFPATCDMDQLDKIFKALGVPTLETWPGMADLPNKILFRPAPGQPLAHIFPEAPSDCLDLLRQLMQFDPEQRITAAAALQHPFFSSEPAPTMPANLPRPSSTRGNRRNAASIPALVQEMLVRPDMLVRQQQQHQPALGLSSSRSLFPFSNHVSFSGRCLTGAGVQQPAVVPDSLLGGFGNSNGASRLGRGGVGSGIEAIGSEQQHTQGFGQMGRSLSGFSGFSDEGAASHPLKCRLSFGSIQDEPTSAQEQLSRPNSVEAGQDAPSMMTAVNEGQQQQQQPGLRRPSPMTCSNQQHSSKGSMRPPLHRTSSAHVAATPVSGRPNSAGAGDVHMQSASAATAAGVKRKVSDLAASLSSAAAAASTAQGAAAGAAVGIPSWLISAEQQQLQQYQPGLVYQATGGYGSVADTPAVGGRSDKDQPQGRAADEADLICPMSLGASAHKRSRKVFEEDHAAAAAAAVVHGDAEQHHLQQQRDMESDLGMQQEQEQRAGPMSIGRRTVRGRRSSMGCCNMDTDGDEQHQHQHQQHSVVGLMLPPANLAGNHNHSSTKHARFTSSAAGQLAAGQEAAAAISGCDDPRQQQLELLLGGGDSLGHQQHTNSGSRGALQLLQPWQQAGSAAAGPSSSNAATADPAQHTFPDCPMSLEQQHRTAAGGQRSQLTAPSTGRNSDAQGDSALGGESVGPCTSHRLGCLIWGLHEGLPDVGGTVEGLGLGLALGFTPGTGQGLTEADLALMDPHQLAEFANQWKPIVPSAEKRYLKERKLQMDEALLQASQPDNAHDQSPGNVLSPGFNPRKTVMLGSPLDDRHRSSKQCSTPGHCKRGPHCSCAGYAAPAQDMQKDTEAAVDCNGAAMNDMAVISRVGSSDPTGYALQQQQQAAAESAMPAA